MIKVLFFARLRDQLNCEQLQVSVEQITANGQHTSQELLQYLCKTYPEWQAPLTEQKIFIAVNQEVSQSHTILHSGDEVAFFPPVTGG